jgi:CheY-like chemotaxis protein
MPAVPPGTRVLIVEDQVIIALATEEALVSAGCTVCGVGYNASAAIRLALVSRPDAIVMDVRLGADRDGVEIAEILRAQGVEAPIVFVTADNDEKTLARIRAVGGAWLLRKPIVPGQLEATLAHAVARHPAPAPL